MAAEGFAGLVEVGIQQLRDFLVSELATCWREPVSDLYSAVDGRNDSFQVAAFPGCSTSVVELVEVAAFGCNHPIDCRLLQLQLVLPWAFGDPSNAVVVLPSFHPFLLLDFPGPCSAAVPSVETASDSGSVGDSAAAWPADSSGPYEIPLAFALGLRSEAVALSAAVSWSLDAAVAAVVAAASAAVAVADLVGSELPADQPFLAFVLVVAESAASCLL